MKGVWFQIVKKVELKVVFQVFLPFKCLPFKCTARASLYTKAAFSVCFGADGSRVFAGYEKTIRAWDVSRPAGRSIY